MQSNATVLDGAALAVRRGSLSKFGLPARAAFVGATFAIALALLLAPFVIDGRLVSINSGELRLVASTAIILAVLVAIRLLFGTILALIGAIAVSIFNTLNYITFQYMNAPFFDVSYYLPRPSINDTSFGTYVGYLFQYVSFGVWLWSLAVALVAVLLTGAAASTGRRTIHFLVVAALAASVALSTHFVAPAQAIPEDLSRYANIIPLHRLSELGGAERPTPPPPLGLPATDTIVLIINESTGSDALDSSGSGLLSDRLVALAGGPGSGLTRLPNAVANATVTDVSIPSILSGAYPTDGLQVIDQSPLIFDFAKSAGFATSFFSSSIVKWANFDKFLQGSAIDVFYSGENSGSPLINDFAVDDALMMDAYDDYIRGSDPADKLLIVVYPNALHNPFQRDSSLGIPADITDRRRRATYLIEQAHERLFDALKAAGRFDQAAIFITGDHGLNMRPGAMSRLNQIDPVNLAPIFLVKPPSTVSGEWADAFAQNGGRLVANVDIAPSILDLLGYRPGQGHGDGISLFDEIPESRISYALNNTEWRQWPQSTFSIARGSERFNCSVAQFCLLENVESGDRTAYRAAHTDTAWWRYIELAEENPRLARSLSDIIRRFFAGGWYFTPMETFDLPLAEMRLGGRSDLGDAGGVDWKAGAKGDPVFYGPYMPLPKGSYRVEWQGTAGRSESGTSGACILDVFDGEAVLAAAGSEVDPRGVPHAQSVEFTAPRDEERVEFRLWCDDAVSGSVRKLNLTFLG